MVRRPLHPGLWHSRMKSAKIGLTTMRAMSGLYKEENCFRVEGVAGIVKPNPPSLHALLFPPDLWAQHLHEMKQLGCSTDVLRRITQRCHACWVTTRNVDLPKPYRTAAVRLLAKNVGTPTTLMADNRVRQPRVKLIFSRFGHQDRRVGGRQGQTDSRVRGADGQGERDS